MFGKERLNSFEEIFSSDNEFVYKVLFEKTSRQFYLSINDKCKVQSFLVKKFIKPSVSKMRLSLPLDTIWYTYWGGNTLKQNRHIKSNRQAGAFDFAIKDENNSTHLNQGKTNSDYYAWNKNILSPCDGTVIEAVDGIEDNIPRVINNLNPHGNFVLLKCNNTSEEYIAMYHFKKESIRVKQGDSIKEGQIIAKCGNSGRSTEPHLHFHIQDSKVDSKAVGITAKFDNVFVINKDSIFNYYTPLKGDYIVAPYDKHNVFIYSYLCLKKEAF